MLNSNRDVLDRLAHELLEKETLDHKQIAEIFSDVKKIDERPQWLSSSERPVSAMPPIDVPRAEPQPEPGVAAAEEAPQSSRSPETGGSTKPATV